MKTLTIIISDEAAQAIDAAVEGSSSTPEQVASHLVEAAFTDDWGDLTAEDIAAIEEGLAEIERGDTVPHAVVVSEFRQKFEA